ncbi:hypothetical protein J132_04026, partial [Termitomyces sp. J132]
AFSHDQVQAATTSGFLAIEHNNFSQIAECIVGLNLNVLKNVAEWMAKGELVKLSTNEEHACFKAINDLDAVSGWVGGAPISKKHMRNEIWSLVIEKGAPSWFITLLPIDVQHPICLYYTDTGISFCPSISIVGADRQGLSGNTSAYYSTVKQQGWMTLHLHMLLWLCSSLLLEDARCRIIDLDSSFQKALVDYLEASFTGDFTTGSMNNVANNIKSSKTTPDNGYMDSCNVKPTCVRCRETCNWWKHFFYTVDDLVFCCNVHTCGTSFKKDGIKKKGKEYKGCMDNKWGKCKAHFPKQLFKQTEVDPMMGALNMQKAEPWLNTFTPALTYLFRCNTDVTSLQSGTAVKAVLLYITKYITKMSLKTYTAFEVVRTVLSKNQEIVNCHDPSPGPPHIVQQPLIPQNP